LAVNSAAKAFPPIPIEAELITRATVDIESNSRWNIILSCFIDKYSDKKKAFCHRRILIQEK
jgi:hypothetical protein